MQLKENSSVVVRVEHLYKSFGFLQVLHDISTEISRGEVIAIIGPSGSGKSTFLRCLNLLEIPITNPKSDRAQEFLDKML